GPTSAVPMPASSLLLSNCTPRRANMGSVARLHVAVLSATLACGCGRLGFADQETDIPADASADVDAMADAAAEADVARVTTGCGLEPTIGCNGFESGTVEWRVESAVGGTVAVISDEPFLGDHAMRATAGMGGYA